MTNAVETARAALEALKAATPDYGSPDRAAHDAKVDAAWKAFVAAKDAEKHPWKAMHEAFVAAKDAEKHLSPLAKAYRAIASATANVTAAALAPALASLNNVSITEGPDFLTVVAEGLTMQVWTCPEWVMLNYGVHRGLVEIIGGPENFKTAIAYGTVKGAVATLTGPLACFRKIENK
jgi:hypothetical protein